MAVSKRIINLPGLGAGAEGAGTEGAGAGGEGERTTFDDERTHRGVSWLRLPPGGQGDDGPQGAERVLHSSDEIQEHEIMRRLK